MRPLRQNFKLPFMDLENWDFEKITNLRRGWVNISMNRDVRIDVRFAIIYQKYGF